jgi:signal transduction histidine kinase
MMQHQGKTILLVSDDAAFCAEARRELEAKEKGLRVAAVRTVDAARRIVADAAPAVILLEDTSIPAEPPIETDTIASHASPLESAVSDLAATAPVIVIGAADHAKELTALVAAGVADFVARSGGCLPVALTFVEERLRQACNLSSDVLQTAMTDEMGGEAFGEVLRHELNNPLTGILGNAELLLAEVRRKNDGQLPNGGQQRLETIAALAVRLRETVRRLSQDWETRHRPASAQRSLQHGMVRERTAH